MLSILDNSGLNSDLQIFITLVLFKQSTLIIILTIFVVISSSFYHSGSHSYIRSKIPFSSQYHRLYTTNLYKSNKYHKMEKESSLFSKSYNTEESTNNEKYKSLWDDQLGIWKGERALSFSYEELFNSNNIHFQSIYMSKDNKDQKFIYIFGYGSLIWNPGNYLEKCRSFTCSSIGWKRMFAQVFLIILFNIVIIFYYYLFYLLL
jgi:hypothetical protein